MMSVVGNRLQVSRSSASFGRQHRVWSDIRPVLEHTNFASHVEDLRSVHDQHDEERQQQEACFSLPWECHGQGWHC